MKQLIKRFVISTMWKGALRIYRAEKPYVIVVGGSVGKTSTKEAIATMLEHHGKPVRKTFGNLATDSGVPLSLLGFEDQPAGVMGWLQVLIRALTVRPRTQSAETPYYVLEYSSDTLGETAFLVEKIAPDIAVYCTIVPVHMEQYKTEAVMVEETMMLHSTLKPGGMIIANAEDPLQRTALAKQKDVVWYGDGTKSLCSLQASKMTPEGLSIDLLLNGKRHTVQTAVLAEYQVSPLLAAASVAHYVEMEEKQILKGIAAYTLPPGRGKLIVGKNDMTIIDDTANASPEAVIAGLAVLQAYAGKRRSVAILGTMNELGDMALSAHTLIAKEAAQRAQFFIAVGVYGNDMLRAARDAGLSPTQMIAFKNPDELKDHLFQLVHRHDVVYLKASQNGMRLERIVKELMAKPEEASKLLVRQGPFWR